MIKKTCGKLKGILSLPLIRTFIGLPLGIAIFYWADVYCKGGCLFLSHAEVLLVIFGILSFMYMSLIIEWFLHYREKISPFVKKRFRLNATPRVLEFMFFVGIFFATLMGTQDIVGFTAIYGISLACGFYHYVLRVDDDIPNQQENVYRDDKQKVDNMPENFDKYDLEWFRKNQASGELKFFNQYEDDIRKLFKDLAKIGVINIIFDEKHRKRLTEFRWVFYASGLLHNNVMAFTKLPEEERNELEELLIKKGFHASKETVAYQMLSLLTQGYHTHLEDIKFHMELFIDFDYLIKKKLVSKTKFKSFGWMILELNKLLKGNDFLEFLNTGIRNSIVHRTYFFVSGKIHFCKDIFDENPKQMTLAEFMIEAKQMNILALGFFLIYVDMFKK